MTDRDHPFLSTAVFVLVAFIVRLALHPWLGDRSPLLIFMVAVVIAAGRYGAGPGLLAMVLSLLAGTFAFILPAHAWLASADVFANLAVFLVTSVAMLTFAAHLKSSQQRSMRLQAELQQAHTQSAVGAIASTLAHELNQPLSAASNYIAACRRLVERLDGEEKSAALSGLAQSEVQIRRTGEIIRHARDLVGNRSAEREAVSLRSMVQRVAEVLRASGGCQNAAVRIQIEPRSDVVHVNPVQIEQVLMNLMRNACEAAKGAQCEVVIAARRDGDSALVEVRDSGGGIPEDRLRRLFSGEIRSTSGGLGLGLSISRAIVEAHGGRIWAENNGIGGASFFFRLPRAG